MNSRITKGRQLEKGKRMSQKKVASLKEKMEESRSSMG